MTRVQEMPDSAPHTDVQLERQVLGQMLACREARALYVGADLREDDFFRTAHRAIYRAIAAVVATGTAPDLVTVGLELRRVGALETVGAAYYTQLVDSAVKPTPEAAIFTANALANLAAKRGVASALETGDVSDVAAALDATANRGGDQRRVFDADGQLDAIREDLARDQLGRVFLGLPSLDNIIEGVRAGEVLGLMARPGIGKTLVLGHVARAAADADLGHVFFSLEMPAAQIAERLGRAHYGLGRAAFRDRLMAGAIDPEDYTRTFRQFVIVDAPGLSVAQMTARLRQLHAGPLKGTPLRLVTVDHLGLIGGDRKMTTYDRVSTQARELKELAKRFNCSVLLAVQVNRDAGGDGSKELGLGAARDSGVVEEAMDYLVAMRRLDRSQTLGQVDREKYRDVLFAKVVKNRHGAPDAEIAIRLDGRTLEMLEDPTLRIAEDDLSRIAASAGQRRR